MDLLGLDVENPEWYQVVLRTIIVFITALVFIRVSGMRTFGTSSAFDVIVTITLGAVLGRGIMGHYPFLNCIVAAAVIVLLHRLVSNLSSRYQFFQKLVSGTPETIFKNGRLLHYKLKKYGIAEEDVVKALHEENLADYTKVKVIILETDGVLSIVKKEDA